MEKVTPYNQSYTDDETGEESEEEDSSPWELILNEVYQNINPIRDAYG